MGDILGDLSSRRAHILGTEPEEGRGTKIRAIVPQAELFTYASSVQSMTQGRATFRRTFKGYEEAPLEVAQKVIEETAKARTDEVAAH
jgi:elongation factor G